MSRRSSLMPRVLGALLVGLAVTAGGRMALAVPTPQSPPPPSQEASGPARVTAVPEGPRSWFTYEDFLACLLEWEDSVWTAPGIPDKPVRATLFILNPSPKPQDLEGLWSFVQQGGHVVLPLETPVALDDPLVNMVSANGGVKIKGPIGQDLDPPVIKKYGLDPNDEDLPVVPVQYVGSSWWSRVLTNLPTSLGPFTEPDAKVMYILYNGGANPEGGTWSRQYPSFAALIETPKGGRAMVIADFSIVTNQMLSFDFNRLWLKDALDWATGDGPKEIWLVGRLKPEVREQGDHGAREPSTAIGRVGWGDLLALPLALAPFLAARRRPRAEDYLSERAAETSFRQMVRTATTVNDYRLPGKQLAAEVTRALWTLVAVDAGDRAACEAACLALYARGHPRVSRRHAGRFIRRLRSLLSVVPSFARGEMRIPELQFARAYADANFVLTQMGGVLHGGPKGTRQGQRG